MTTGTRRFALRMHGSEILLPPGQLVLGRSASCHVVLDDGMVSRRHAALITTPQGASIEDLNSINGVYVNDERLGRGVRMLRHGDRLLLGNTELEVVQLAVMPSLEASRADTLSGTDPVVPGGGEDDFDELPSTRRVDALELLGTAVDQAYAAGRPDIAERLLADHLRDVLHDTRAGRPPPVSILDTAVEQSLRLAREIGRGIWFDYALELLSARRVPPSKVALGLASELFQRLDHVNLHLLGDYLGILRVRAPEFTAEQSQALAATEQIYARFCAEATGG